MFDEDIDEDDAEDAASSNTDWLDHGEELPVGSSAGSGGSEWTGFPGKVSSSSMSCSNFPRRQMRVCERKRRKGDRE